MALSLPLNCLRHYLKHTLTPPLLNADVVWFVWFTADSTCFYVPGRAMGSDSAGVA